MGAGLYAASQLREHAAMLDRGVFGKPALGEPVLDRHDRSRRADPPWACFDTFNAPRDEYTASSRPRHTGALKLAGEAYPFARAGAFCSPSTTTTRSRHPPIRAREGADVVYAPIECRSCIDDRVSAGC